MQRAIEGIIVSTVDYKESSKIINILTLDEGIIGVVARGSKNLKNHLRTSTMVLSYGVFYLKDDSKRLPVVLEVDIINSFKEIRKDFLKMNYSLFLLELASQVFKHDNNCNIYKILISGLIKINEGYDPKIITNIIEMKFLNNLGIMPNLNCCVDCGSKNNIVTISSNKGGYLCNNCVLDEYKYDIKTIKLIRMLCLVNLDNISKIEVSEKVKNELNLFIDDYYDRYSGLYLKSKQVIDNLSKI